AITDGDCKARSDEGRAPPLELEHRLCHGTVTVVIWAEETLAARAAGALRPLSRGANGRRPEIAFNHSPRCLPYISDRVAHASPRGRDRARSATGSRAPSK